MPQPARTSRGFKSVLDQAARMGQGGDKHVIHATGGEIIIPLSVQTPPLLNIINHALRSKGLSIDRFRIGSPANKRNPKTGARQFDDDGSGDTGGDTSGSDAYSGGDSGGGYIGDTTGATVDNTGDISSGPAPGESTTGYGGDGYSVDNSTGDVTGGPQLSTPGAEPDYGNSLDGLWSGSPLQSTQPPGAPGGTGIGGKDAIGGAIDNGQGGAAFGPGQTPTGPAPGSTGTGVPGSGVPDISDGRENNPISGRGETTATGPGPGRGSGDAFSSALSTEDRSQTPGGAASPALGGSPAAPPTVGEGTPGPTQSTIDFLAGLGGDKNAMTALNTELTGAPAPSAGATPSTGSPAPPAIEGGGGGGSGGNIGNTVGASVQNTGAGVSGGPAPGESTTGYTGGSYIDNPSGAGPSGGATPTAAGAPNMPPGVRVDETGRVFVMDNMGKEQRTGYVLGDKDMSNKQLLESFATAGKDGMFGGVGKAVADPYASILTQAQTPSWGPTFQALVGQLVTQGNKALWGAGLPAGLGTLVGAAGGASKAASKGENILGGAALGALPGGDLISKLIDTGGDVGKTAGSFLTDPLASHGWAYSGPDVGAGRTPNDYGGGASNDNPAGPQRLSAAPRPVLEPDTGFPGGGGGGSGGGGGGGGSGGGGGGGIGGILSQYYPVYGVNGQIVGWSTRPQAA